MEDGARLAAALAAMGFASVQFPVLRPALFVVAAALIFALAWGLLAIIRWAASIPPPRPAPGSSPPPPATVPRIIPRPPRQRFLDAVARCHWYTLERVVAEILRGQGYPVEHRGGAAPDAGADILVKVNGGTVVVQVKKWESWKVSLRVMREILGAKVSAGADGAWLVATARVTRDARDFAGLHGIRIICPEDLADWLVALPDPGPVLEIAEDPVPHCPLCRVPMVRRTARRGTHAGGQFWGCPRYPACRQIVRDGP